MDREKLLNNTGHSTQGIANTSQRVLTGPPKQTLTDELGIKDFRSQDGFTVHTQSEELISPSEHEIKPDPAADQVDLSQLRGQGSTMPAPNGKNATTSEERDTELAALAELLPDVTQQRRPQPANEELVLPVDAGDEADDGNDTQVLPDEVEPPTPAPSTRKMSATPATPAAVSADTHDDVSEGEVPHNTVQQVGEMLTRGVANAAKAAAHEDIADVVGAVEHNYESNDIQGLDATSFDDYPESETALEGPPEEEEAAKIPKEFYNMSSGQSISTATQTHEVRMPMYLPNFKPATGCTNASDFIVRCFVARLRSGITVVKHGRSRWCKSRLRVLQIHPDGRSLTWKPAEGEPTTNRKPPKLDLSTCLEVRHAWSPDPHNPMYTGTPILRQKCEAANAHKSFALIFKHRTVDITAVTADQCKVLMEGFSALCFRLQVASLAGSRNGKQKARPMPEEDGVSVTASNTLTNTSTPKNR